MNKIDFKNEKGAVDSVVVFCICFVILVIFVVSSIEYFIPISKYGDMKDICHSTLFKMETQGSLSDSERINVKTKLEGIGLSNVVVTGTQNAKYGEDINLKVEAEYQYSKLNNFLSRSMVTEHFIYDRTSCQRKVIN